MGFYPAAVVASASAQPYQFNVSSYGAVGNGKIGTGGTGTSGLPGFTDAGASFTSADVGKLIMINQGANGSATNPFCGTILQVNSATSITLSGNLAANAANAPYIYGTDDAAAINRAVSAAANYAVTLGNNKCQVLFQPLNYMLGALTQSTTFTWAPFNSGSYTYNTHIPLPFNGQFARKLIIDFLGVGDASEPDFWGSTLPSLSGTCLVSAVFGTGQPNGTFQQQSIVGTPSAQTGIGNGGITGGNFANVLVNVQGITLVAPWNSQQYGFDFRWSAQANVINGSYLAFAPVNSSGASVGGPYLSSTNIVTNAVGVGNAMPLSQNNDNTNLGIYTCEGAAVGCIFSEHITAGERIGTLYCDIGLEPVWNTGSTIHGGSLLYWTCEACNGGIKTNASNTNLYPLFIGNADFEVINTYYVNDAGFNLTGTMYWNDISQWTPATVGILNASHYNIVNNRVWAGPWVANAGLSVPASPAAPATGVAQQNTSYRPATICATATTGITAYAVGVTSGALTTFTVTAGNNVPVYIDVGSGGWYSVTYPGVLTTNWVWR